MTGGVVWKRGIKKKKKNKGSQMRTLATQAPRSKGLDCKYDIFRGVGGDIEKIGKKESQKKEAAQVLLMHCNCRWRWEGLVEKLSFRVVLNKECRWNGRGSDQRGDGGAQKHT